MHEWLYFSLPTLFDVLFCCQKHFVNCKMVSNDPNDMWMTDNNYVYRGGNRVES